MTENNGLGPIRTQSCRSLGEMEYAVYITPRGGEDGIDLIAQNRGPAGKSVAILPKRKNDHNSNILC